MGLCSGKNSCPYWISGCMPNKRHYAHACVPLRCLADAILARLLLRKCTVDLASHKMRHEQASESAQLLHRMQCSCSFSSFFCQQMAHDMGGMYTYPVCCVLLHCVLCCAVLCCAVLCCAVLHAAPADLSLLSPFMHLSFEHIPCLLL